MPPSVQPDPDLAAVIRRLRSKRGMTQEDVARGADLTVNGYAKIERGDVSPTWPTVRAVARALDVSLKQLGAEVDNEHRKTEESAPAA